MYGFHRPEGAPAFGEWVGAGARHIIELVLMGISAQAYVIPRHTVHVAEHSKPPTDLFSASPAGLAVATTVEFEPPEAPAAPLIRPLEAL